jgi:ubiquinol-cytochrome c reductase cytochrome b subunit
MSWISSVLLLAFTMGIGFTGQLLRWDSNGMWSAVVGAEQAGRIRFISTWVSRFILAGRLSEEQLLADFLLLTFF